MSGVGLLPPPLLQNDWPQLSDDRRWFEEQARLELAAADAQVLVVNNTQADNFRISSIPNSQGENEAEVSLDEISEFDTSRGNSYQFIMVCY